MKKALALAMAITLLVICVVGGTLAWLTATDDTVVNTFTTSDISVELTETTGTEYKMIPGYTIAKDPKATVLEDSEECWLYVKVEKSANFDTYLEYTIAEGWTLVDGQNNVYARKVLSADIGTAFSVLEDDEVTVKGSVTKADMNALDADGATKPSMTLTVCASQLHKNAKEDFTAAEAWSNIG